MFNPLSCTSEYQIYTTSHSVFKSLNKVYFCKRTSNTSLPVFDFMTKKRNYDLTKILSIGQSQGHSCLMKFILILFKEKSTAQPLVT